MAKMELTFKSNEKNDEQEKEKAVLGIYDEQHLTRLRDFKRYNDAALRILLETSVQQVVNAYEKFIGEIIQWYFLSDPEAVLRDKVISYQDLLQFSSLDEAKRRVVESEVTDFLRTKDTNEQFKYFKDYLAADVPSRFLRLGEFKELVLRRHLIVHAGGIVTAEYLRKVKSIKGLSIKTPKEGQVVELKTSYVMNSWCLVYSLGVIMLHLVIQYRARRQRDKDMEDEIDSFVNNSAFTSIQQGQFLAAEIILKYASKLRLRTESANLMVVVNLAQTFKWQGNEEACRTLLDQRDWSASNNLFKLCVGALREDNSVEKLFYDVVKEGELTLENLYQWPVFKKFRKNSLFPKMVEKAYGKREKNISEMFPPSLLNFQYDKMSKEIVGYLKRKTSSSRKKRKKTNGGKKLSIKKPDK